MVYGRFHNLLLDWKHRVDHPLGPCRTFTLEVPLMTVIGSRELQEARRRILEDCAENGHSLVPGTFGPAARRVRDP